MDRHTVKFNNDRLSGLLCFPLHITVKGELNELWLLIWSNKRCEEINHCCRPYLQWPAGISPPTQSNMTVMLCHEMINGLETKVQSPLARTMLRSAVGKTHDLRSDLWWTIPLRILLDQFWDTLWILADQVSPSQTLRCPTYGSTWVVLWLLFCRSAPSTFPVTWSTFKVHFGESLVVRLYSEIDHIHLSSEAQCVSNHLPQVDSHNSLGQAG